MGFYSDWAERHPGEEKCAVDVEWVLKKFDELGGKLCPFKVNDIFMSTSSNNPASQFPGTTWAAWGSGRVPVGVNTGDTEFNTVEKTGGAKTHTLTTSEMPSHTHSVVLGSHNHSISDPGHKHTFNGAGPEWGKGTTPVTTDQNKDKGALSMNNSTTGITIENKDLGTKTSESSGSGSAHNNLQPYITCYMWKRTA